MCKPNAPHDTTQTTYDVGALKRTSELPNEAGSSRAPSAAAAAVAPPPPPPLHQLRESPPDHRQPQRFLGPDPPRQTSPVVQRRVNAIDDRTNAEPSPAPSSIEVPFQSPTKPFESRSGTNLPPSEPKSEEARLREERKKMAAAKQAALRLRKEEEEKARKESEAREKEGKGKEIERGQMLRDKSALSRVHDRGFDEMELESLKGGIDEYDSALAEANIGEEDDILIEEEEISSRTIAETPKGLRSSSRLMDDSGIFMLEDVKSANGRPLQRPGNAAKWSTPSSTRRRFVPPSSSPIAIPPNEKGKSSSPLNLKRNLPSSSPRSSKGRRLSIIGNQSEIRVDQQVPPRSQRSRPGEGPLAGKRNQGEVANKKPRASQSRRPI